MSHRRQRVAHELRDRIAEIVGRRVRDPRLELVAITDVEVSPDLSYARVFYRSSRDSEETARAFAAAKSFIRRNLAAEVALRRVPELDFRRDMSVEHGARIEELLDEIAEQRHAREPRDANEEDPS